MKRLYAVVTALMLFGAHSVFSAEDPVLATMGDTKVTLSDLNRMIDRLDPDQKKAIEEQPQLKATLLKRYVQNTVLANLAREKKFDQREDIKEQLKMSINDFLALEYIKKEVYEKIKITEDDLKTYYKSFPDNFKTPEMVRVRHIFFLAPGKEARARTKAKAEEVLKRIRSGEDFIKLASEFSEDTSTNSKGGDLGFFPRGKMIKELEQAAFSLKPGEISDVIETPYGYHIVKVQEKKEAVLEPYDKVKDTIREKVLADFKRSKVDDFVDEAMKNADVKIYLEATLPKK